jgi:hypothetical protein
LAEALTYDSIGDYAKALPLIKRYLAIQEKVLDPATNKVFILNNLNVFYKNMKNYAKALTANNNKSSAQ